MRQWTFPVTIVSGLASLAQNNPVILWSAEGSRIRIDVSNGQDGEANGDDPLLRVLAALHGLGFTVSSRGYTILPLPSPWHSLLDNRSLPSNTLFDAAGLCVELWLAPGDTSDLDSLRDVIAKRGEHLEAEVREALTYWLLCSERELGGRDELRRSWRSDTTDVLVMRTTERVRRRRPTEPLLASAQTIFERLTDLRLRTVTLSDYEALVSELTTVEATLPLAFQQAIWWEASYRFAELQQREALDEVTRRYREAAEKLLAILPGLTTVGLPGFGISIGQRAYYQGEFPLALQAYIKEWNADGQLHRQRLKRLFANVLTDLGQLTLAQRLAEDSLREQEQAGDPETYKTLGRCGEIALRQGRIDRARTYYEHSLEFQNNNPPDGQTLTYLGHAALLSGKLEEAADCYAKAREADLDSGRLNGYTLMGEAALALHRGDCDEVFRNADLLATTPRHEIIGDDLPFAVITLAECLATGDKTKAVEAHRKLLKDNYVIEGLAMLPSVFPKFDSGSKALNQIEDTLRRWAKSLAELPHEFRTTDVPESAVAPAHLLKSIAEIRRLKSWDPLVSIAARIYPVNLVLVPNHKINSQ